MLFRSDSDVVAVLLKFEKRDQIIPYELRSNRSAYQGREFLHAKRHVLFDLYPVQAIVSALGLDGNNVVRASSVYLHVYLINFYLADSFDARSQMAL